MAHREATVRPSSPSPESFTVRVEVEEELPPLSLRDGILEAGHDAGAGTEQRMPPQLDADLQTLRRDMVRLSDAGLRDVGEAVMAKVAALTAALERAYRRAAQAERREQTQVAKYRDTVKRLESEKSTARQQVEYYRREYTRWEKQYNDLLETFFFRMKEVYPEYHQEKWLAAHGDPGSPGGDPERRFQGDVAKEAIRAQMLAARLETEKRNHEQAAQSLIQQLEEKDQSLVYQAQQHHKVREELERVRGMVKGLQDAAAEGQQWLELALGQATAFVKGVGELRDWVMAPKTLSRQSFIGVLHTQLLQLCLEQFKMLRHAQAQSPDVPTRSRMARVRGSLEREMRLIVGLPPERDGLYKAEVESTSDVTSEAGSSRFERRMTEILRRLADPQQQVRLFQSVPMPFECTPEEVAEALQSRTEDSPKAQASARWVALWDKAVQESRMGDVAQAVEVLAATSATVAEACRAATTQPGELWAVLRTACLECVHGLRAIAAPAAQRGNSSPPAAAAGSPSFSDSGTSLPVVVPDDPLSQQLPATTAALLEVILDAVAHLEEPPAAAASPQQKRQAFFPDDLPQSPAETPTSDAARRAMARRATSAGTLKPALKAKPGKGDGVAEGEPAERPAVASPTARRATSAAVLKPAGKPGGRPEGPGRAERDGAEGGPRSGRDGAGAKGDRPDKAREKTRPSDAGADQEAEKLKVKVAGLERRLKVDAQEHAARLAAADVEVQRLRQRVGSLEAALDRAYLSSVDPPPSVNSRPPPLSPTAAVSPIAPEKTDHANVGDSPKALPAGAGAAPPPPPLRRPADDGRPRSRPAPGPTAALVATPRPAGGPSPAADPRPLEGPDSAPTSPGTPDTPGNAAALEVEPLPRDAGPPGPGGPRVEARWVHAGVAQRAMRAEATQTTLGPDLTAAATQTEAGPAPAADAPIGPWRRPSVFRPPDLAAGAAEGGGLSGPEPRRMATEEAAVQTDVTWLVGSFLTAAPDPPPSASHPSHLPPSTPTLAASPPPPPAPPPQSPPTTLSPPRLTHAATQTESDLVPAGSPGGDFAAAAAATETPKRPRSAARKAPTASADADTEDALPSSPAPAPAAATNPFAPLGSAGRRHTHTPPGPPAPPSVGAAGPAVVTQAEVAVAHRPVQTAPEWPDAVRRQGYLAVVALSGGSAVRQYCVLLAGGRLRQYEDDIGWAGRGETDLWQSVVRAVEEPPHGLEVAGPGVPGGWIALGAADAEDRAKWAAGLKEAARHPPATGKVPQVSQIIFDVCDALKGVEQPNPMDPPPIALPHGAAAQPWAPELRALLEALHCVAAEHARWQAERLRRSLIEMEVTPRPHTQARRKTNPDHERRPQSAAASSCGSLAPDPTEGSLPLISPPAGHTKRRSLCPPARPWATQATERTLDRMFGVPPPPPPPPPDFSPSIHLSGKMKAR